MSRGTETRRCDIVFQSARDSFLDTISQEERAQFSNCANVEMLMEDVGAFSEFKSDHRRASKFLERIKNFGDQIQPYFEVCGILLQAHPEWTAIAWGAFRLILKLASNFTSFFDDLANMLERLSLMMPRYAEVLDITKNQFSERFCSSLEKLYVDLFDFFKSVSRVFTQKGGISKRFIPGKTEAQSDLTSDCLSYLLFRAPAQPLSGDLHQAASTCAVNKAFPFLGYASGVWPYHLAEASIALNERIGAVSESEELAFQNLSRLIVQFLSKPLILNAWVESTYTFVTKNQVLPLYEKIQKWCRWATAAADTGNMALHSAFGAVPTELSAFIDDLQVINGLWESTLHAGPNQIWNDITAFTPSPFLAKTSAVSVNSMPTLNFGESQLSLKPLTTISAETHDGNRLGVLSIWPNKHFEDKWNGQITDAFPISPERNEYAGWVARFEMWAIESDEPRKLKDLRFKLDKDEVETHVAAFIDFIRLKRSSKHSKQGQYWSQWALPFPTTISDSLEIVLILRTIYLLDLGQIAGPIVEFQSPDLLRSAIIPIPEEFLLQRDRDPSRLKANSAGLGKISLSHSYSLQIERNDQYILWKQVQGINIAADRRPLVTSLAVFQLDRSGAQPRCHFCGQFGGGDAQQCITTAEFHPNLPLVVLHSGSLISGSAVYLWSFASNACMAFGAQVHNRASEGKRGFSDVFTSLCTAPRSIEYLNFSTCGTQVIIKHHEQALQDVCSIQSNPVYQTAMEQHSQQRPLNALSTAQVSCPNHDRSRSEDTLEKSSSTNELSEIFTATHSRKAELATNDSKREIRIKRISQRGEEVQPLLLLPDMHSADIIRFQVGAPMTREQKIRIVLHKAEQPWYTISGPADVALPALVEKDVRALAPLQKRCFKREEIECPAKKRIHANPKRWHE